MKKKIILSLSVLLFIKSIIADSVDFNLVKLKKIIAEASSFLKEPNKPDRFYAPDKAFDTDRKTAWCEGVNGDGVGEKLTLKIDPIQADGLFILPGYGVNRKIYYQNNRIKDYKITLTLKDNSVVILEGTFEDNLCGNIHRDIEYYKDEEIRTKCIYEVPDYMYKDLELNEKKFHACVKRETEFMENFCGFDNYHGGGTKLIFEKKIRQKIKGINLEIKSVYKGSQYEDSCISEISPYYDQG